MRVPRISEIMGRRGDLCPDAEVATMSTLDSCTREDPESLREATDKIRKRKRNTIWIK